MNFEKKDEEKGSGLPFDRLEKGIVLQEKRIFTETPLNAPKCQKLLTKLLYLLLTQGDTFTRTEATDTFFALTRLFQSNDPLLRRLMYLVLKELIPIADDVIIATAPLIKDVTSNNELFKANALRVLSHLADASTLPGIERYFKQSIVDKESYVVSASLVTGLHLMQHGHGEIVKRWVGEVQAALQSKSTMVQYHALGLLHQIRRQDRLAMSKLVQQMSKSSLRSPYAHCLLIRFAAQVILDDRNGQDRSLYDYIVSCLNHKSDMVTYEAAKALCQLPDITSKDLSAAINALNMLLNSLKPTLRFAAVRTLNILSMRSPNAVSACNKELEALIGDSNRSIATLAITTLLKTGDEQSVDQLMKQISGFMSDISDEFKIVVVDAIRTLALKFPQKHISLMSFLANVLRDEGGFEFKQALVNAFFTIIEQKPDAKEIGLSHLCEFIEDCEFTSLSNRVLHLLGKEGPTTATPSKYVRHIYNRVGLEVASVRATAVSALAKFGMALESIRPSVVTLLKRCQNDQDDEVRDRVVYYLDLLEAKGGRSNLQSQLGTVLPVPLSNLEQSLQSYLAHVDDQPFDWTKVSTVETTNVTIAAPSNSFAPSSAPTAPAAPAQASENYAAEIAAIPEYGVLGALLKSSKPVRLTEDETEYMVTCVKHVFAEHFLFQFNVNNTLNDQVLANVVVKLEVGEGEFEVESYRNAPLIGCSGSGTCYTLVRRPPGVQTGSFASTLSYVIKEIDPSTNQPTEDGFDDEYQLEALRVTISDFTTATFVGSFVDAWGETSEESTAEYFFAKFKDLKQATEEIVRFLGLHPCDRTEVVAANKPKHELRLSGRLNGDIPVLARVRMVLEATGVRMQLAVRSPDPYAAETISNSLS